MISSVCLLHVHIYDTFLHICCWFPVNQTQIQSWTNDFIPLSVNLFWEAIISYIYIYLYKMWKIFIWYLCNKNILNKNACMLNSSSWHTKASSLNISFVSTSQMHFIQLCVTVQFKCTLMFCLKHFQSRWRETCFSYIIKNMQRVTWKQTDRLSYLGLKTDYSLNSGRRTQILYRT